MRDEPRRATMSSESRSRRASSDHCSGSGCVIASLCSSFLTFIFVEEHVPRKSQGRSEVASSVGLSLALVGTATAASAGASPNPSLSASSARPQMEVDLFEEEVNDVSLATFYVFDKEGAIL